MKNTANVNYRWTVFSTHREPGEISKGGVTWVHGTAVFDVMSLLLRSVFAEIANAFAFFWVLHGIWSLFVKRMTIVGNITAFHVTFAASNLWPMKSDESIFRNLCCFCIVY